MTADVGTKAESLNKAQLEQAKVKAVSLVENGLGASPIWGTAAAALFDYLSENAKSSLSTDDLVRISESAQLPLDSVVMPVLNFLTAQPEAIFRHQFLESRTGADPRELSFDEVRVIASDESSCSSATWSDRISVQWRLGQTQP